MLSVEMKFLETPNPCVYPMQTMAVYADDVFLLLSAMGLVLISLYRDRSTADLEAFPTLPGGGLDFPDPPLPTFALSALAATASASLLFPLIIFHRMK